VTSPVVTIELTADGVQEVSARIRTAEDQVEAAVLIQRIAPALEMFDRAVRKQLGASMRAKAKIRRQCTTPPQSPENLHNKRETE
jgi:hypothetical protein